MKLIIVPLVVFVLGLGGALMALDTVMEGDALPHQKALRSSAKATAANPAPETKVVAEAPPPVAASPAADEAPPAAVAALAASEPATVKAAPVVAAPVSSKPITFMSEGLIRVEKHEFGATAIYHEASHVEKPVVAPPVVAAAAPGEAAVPVVAAEPVVAAAPPAVAAAAPAVAAAPAQNKSITFMPEGLVRVEKHLFGATASYYVAPQAKITDPAAVPDQSKTPPYMKDGLIRVDEHEFGAPAIYF